MKLHIYNFGFTRSIKVEETTAANERELGATQGHFFVDADDAFSQNVFEIVHQYNNLNAMLERTNGK